MRIKRSIFIILSLSLILISGCSKGDDAEYPSEYPSSISKTMDEVLLPTSPGSEVMEDPSGLVTIDYSNRELGYIQVKRLLDTPEKLKMQIVNNDATLEEHRNFAYYDLTEVNEYVTFPLVYGNGEYSIVIYLNTSGTKYMSKFEGRMQVELVNEQTPYLYPNQVVDYNTDSKAIQEAFQLCKDDTNDLQRVKTFFDYITENISYDEEKAEATQNTYVLPVIDETLALKKGICFDYASLMAAMCRSQQIPCKVVVGNTSIEYHAWVEVWLEGQGWINPTTLFEAEEWSRADPTFAASNTEYNDYYETIYEY